jgi:putative endonuclease
MYYFYLLKNQKNNKLYRGSTSNLEKRLKEHNFGKVKSTRNFRPWDLIYYEAYQTKTLAQKTENFYKKSQGRRQLKKKLEL